MSDTKKIIKSTGIYFVGNVLSKVIVFFMLPLYTKYIPASDMGYYDTAMAVVTFFSTVLFLDIGSGIMRFMFEKKEVEDKNYAIYTGIAIFLFSLALYVVIAVIGGFVFNFEYFVWVALYGFLLCLTNMYGYVARGWGKNSIFAISGLVATAVNVTCNFVCILILGWDYKSLYISSCVAMVASIIILECSCKVIANFSKKFFDKELFKVLLRFSWPLALNSVAFWLLSLANKLVVTLMLDTTQNGYLAIASKFTSVLYLVSSCFQMAWQELAYSKQNKLGDINTGEFYSRAYDLYTRVLMVGLLLVIPIVNIVFPVFINDSYSASAPLVPLALFGTIITILSSFLGSIFGGIKKTSTIFISTMAGAVVNLAVVFSLINVIGVMAANVALLAGFAVNVIFRTITLKKYINLKVRYWYYIVFIPFFVVATFIYNNLGWVYNLAFFFVMCIAGVFVVRKEIKEIAAKIKGIRKNKV